MSKTISLHHNISYTCSCKNEIYILSEDSNENVFRLEFLLNSGFYYFLFKTKLFFNEKISSDWISNDWIVSPTSAISKMLDLPDKFSSF